MRTRGTDGLHRVSLQPEDRYYDYFLNINDRDPPARSHRGSAPWSAASQSVYPAPRGIRIAMLIGAAR
jgi:hypothetical protein